MHESTKYKNTVGHVIRISENGKFFTKTSNGNKAYGPKAAYRGRKNPRPVRTNAGIPMKLRSKLVPKKPRSARA